MRRLYLQYRPVAQDCELLIGLQNAINKDSEVRRLVSHDQLHVTVIHFGVLTEVYEAVKTVQPALSFDSFQQAVDRFVQTAEAALPQTATLQVENYALFGPRQNVLVITLQASDALQAAHATALQALQDCLRDCGLADPAVFMAGNHNLQYALTFRPHIALAKQAVRLPQDVPLPNKLQLTVMPTRYD